MVVSNFLRAALSWTRRFSVTFTLSSMILSKNPFTFFSASARKAAQALAFMRARLSPPVSSFLLAAGCRRAGTASEHAANDRADGPEQKPANKHTEAAAQHTPRATIIFDNPNGFVRKFLHIESDMNVKRFDECLVTLRQQFIYLGQDLSADQISQLFLAACHETRRVFCRSMALRQLIHNLRQALRNSYKDRLTSPFQ